MELLLATAPLLLVIVFLFITFVFSIGEKLLDWKGTVTFYTQHFKGTFIAKMIPLSLVLVILLELITVVLFIMGLFDVFAVTVYTFLSLGLVSCASTLLVLLIGQRFAKDYPGAMSLGVYFLITIVGFMLIP